MPDAPCIAAPTATTAALAAQAMRDAEARRRLVAVEKKLEDQTEFVRWWAENVRWGGRPQKTGADQGRFLRVDAESFTGITHQQVSKWSRRLKDPEKFDEALEAAHD